MAAVAFRASFIRGFSYVTRILNFQAIAKHA
jgi:hypothetical protein